MEYVVEWNLVYRSDWEMLDLIPLDGTVMETRPQEGGDRRKFISRDPQSLYGSICQPLN